MWRSTRRFCTNCIPQASADDGRILPEGLASAIAKDFGSVVRWRQEFVGIASALAGGSGWGVADLCSARRSAHQSDRVGTQSKHRGGVPILALDMYEHAFHLELGAKAGAYIAAFMRNID
ncbi:superoxide dismutase [Bradyrhizobium sp. F1.13.4]